MVPVPFRNTAVDQLLAHARARKSDVARLRATIRKGIAARKFKQLIPYVERLAQLEPDDPQVKQLQRKLRRQFPDAPRTPARPANPTPGPTIVEAIESEPVDDARPSAAKTVEATSAPVSAVVNIPLAIAPIIDTPVSTPATLAAPAAAAIPVQPADEKQNSTDRPAADAGNPAATPSTRIERLARQWSRAPFMVRAGASVAVVLLSVTISFSVFFAMRSGTGGANDGDDRKNSVSGEATATNVVVNEVNPGEASTVKNSSNAKLPKLNWGKYSTLRFPKPGPDSSTTLPKVDFSSRGDRVVLSWSNGILETWQLTPSVQQIAQFSTSKGTGVGSSSPLSSISVSPDGRLVAGTYLDESQTRFDAAIWDTSTGAKVASASSGGSSIGNVCFLSDNKTVLAVSGGRSVVRWRIDSREMTTAIRRVAPGVNRMLATPDDRYLILIRERGFQVFDVNTKRPVWTGSDSNSRLKDVAVSPDGKTIAATFQQDQANFYRAIAWAMNTGKPINNRPSRTPFSFVGIQFLTDEKVALLAGNGQVGQWDVKGGNLALPNWDNGIRSVMTPVLAENAMFVLFSTFDGVLHRRRVFSGRRR